MRPRIYFELAKERFEAELARAEGGQFNRLQAGRILEPLEVARRMDPPMAGAYAIMAEVWSRTAEPPTDDNLRELTEGLRHFPRFGPLLLRGVYLNATHGRPDAAMDLARLGLRHATDDETRGRFEQALAKLAQAPRG